MAEKPMGVTALCVIAIALGAMGLFGGLLGLGALLLNPKTEAPGGKDAKLAELNAQFHEKIQAVSAETRPIQLVLFPVMILSSCLLAGAGIAGTKLRGLPFLKLAFASSLLIDGFGGIHGMIVQARTLGIMRWYFKEMAAVTKMPAGVEMGMQVGMYTGLFFGVGWLIAKTGAYLWGLIYFSRRSVREAFEGGSAPAGPA